MSRYVLPSWNPGHQRQEQVEGEEGNRSSHMHNEQNHPRTAPLVQMSSNDITELIWENGQLAMHGNVRVPPTTPTKPTWNKASDTLESLVQQATYQKETPHTTPQDHTPVNIGKPSFNGASTGRQRAESSIQRQDGPAVMRKQGRSDSEPGNGRSLCGRIHNIGDGSACVSGSSACRDNDTTKNTWASFESARSLTTKATDEDSSCHHSGSSTRRSRAAVIHNQSERKRRDKINQRMKALQKLVPNASKTDKASILDEVIEYLRQLQAQVQVMSARNMSQMMMSLGVQQQLQMPTLAPMGMGVGLGMSMGMLDMANMVHSAPQTLPSLIHPAPAVASAPAFVSPPFVLPRLIPTHVPAQAKLETSNNAQAHLPDPYGAFLAQSMNMDMYNKMTALYGQQVNQTGQALGNPSQTHHVQSD